ncbi:hypothetical protein BDW75DRAFT_210634, partial [Aspergillus navahoensis]
CTGRANCSGRRGHMSKSSCRKAKMTLLARRTPKEIQRTVTPVYSRRISPTGG